MERSLGGRTRRAVRRTAIAALGAAIAALVLGACSPGGSDEVGSSAPASEEAERNAGEPDTAEALRSSAGEAGDASETDAAASEEGPSRYDGAARLPGIEPSVIKTATIDMKVGRNVLDRSIQRATEIAGRFGGFVLSTTVDEDERKTGTVVLRVPSESFEDALVAVEGLGDVDARTVSGEDVSQEFVDLEARLRSWRAQEAVLLRLMRRADTIEDSIRIQQELTAVQLEIEQIRGRLRYLEDQTTYGTITTNLRTGPAPAPNRPGVILERAWSRALDIALGMVSALIVSLGVAVPLGLLGLMGWAVFRVLRPRLQA